MSSSTLARTTGDQSAVAPPAATARPPRRRPDLRRWISPVALVLLWQLASSTGLLAEDELASPARVVTAAVDVTLTGELPEGLVVSLLRVAAGIALGLTVGVGLGLLSGLSRWGAHLVDPPVQMLRTLPHLALVPLFILWFGVGELPKVLLVALGVLFPMYLNVHSGVRGVDPKLLEAATVSGFTRAERLRHVVLPGAMPSTLTGLRLALGVAWLSIVVAETVSADSGLGYMIMNARGVPAHRRDRRRPRGVRAARAVHRRPGAPPRAQGPRLAPGRTGGDAP